jgi:hypothetical protein
MMPDSSLDPAVRENDHSREYLHRRIVTLKIRPGNEEILLEMPGDQPLGKWLGDLLRTLEWPSPAASPAVCCRLETENGKRISEDLSLAQAGVENSDTLVIVMEQTPDRESAEGEPARLGEESGGPLRKDQAKPDFLPLECASLIHCSGAILELDPVPVVIGRASRGIRPDIDLSPWDPGVVVSRKHVVIEKTGGMYILRPERTTNGTFVNGVEIPAGSVRNLSDGDRLQFGFGGEEFIFRLPVE